MSERRWGGLDHGAAFHAEVHRVQNERFRNDLAIERMMREMDFPEPLARSLVLKEPLRVNSPKILVPYVRLALPEGALSALHTIDYEGRNQSQPVVQISLRSRDITSIVPPESSIDLSSDSDPLEAAETYFDLCRSRGEEDPFTQELVVLTRHQELNARTVLRCRQAHAEAVPYRPRTWGPFEQPSSQPRSATISA